MAKEQRKKCTCGKKITDPGIVPEAVYSFWGWLLLFISYTATPKKIYFQCLQCGGTIAVTTDPVLLDRYKDDSEVTKVKEDKYYPEEVDMTELWSETNVPGHPLGPQSERSFEGSIWTIMIVVGSFFVIGIVLLVLLKFI